MSMNQRDPAAGKHRPEGPPAFRVALRGYDRAEVVDYLPQLMARLSETVDRYADAERARAELKREVRSEAQEALEQGREVAMQIRREAEQERAALQRERRRCRNCMTGCWWICVGCMVTSARPWR